MCSWTISLSFGVWYFVIEGFSDEKYRYQLEACEIALNIDVHSEEEAEGKRQMQWDAQSYFPTFH